MTYSDPLTRLVGDPAAFAASVWGRELLVRRADESDGFPDLLPLNWLDEVIATSSSDDIGLWEEGRRLDPSAIQRPGIGRPDPARVAEAFRRGAMLVVSGADRRSPALATVTRGLECRAGVKVAANVYASPVAANGFPVHSDDHDVLVLQLEGSKFWTVWTPGDGQTELVLRPGDVLYVPRKWAHRAVTTCDPSVHVTFAFLGPCWRDMLRTLVAAMPDAGLEESLPFGYLICAGAVRDALAARLPDWGAQLADTSPALIRAAVGEAASPEADATRSMVGELAQARRFSEGRFRRTAKPWLWAREGIQVALSIDAVEVRLPFLIEPALVTLDEGGEVSLADLAPLDRSSGAVLLARLERAGLLEPSDPPSRA